jgi:hypothetical protein
MDSVYRQRTKAAHAGAGLVEALKPAFPLGEVPLKLCCSKARREFFQPGLKAGMRSELSSRSRGWPGR